MGFGTGQTVEGRVFEFNVQSFPHYEAITFMSVKVNYFIQTTILIRILASKKHLLPKT
jgi:hypothetical protein